jgi:hypothetical protein
MADVEQVAAAARPQPAGITEIVVALQRAPRVDIARRWSFAGDLVGHVGLAGGVSATVIRIFYVQREAAMSGLSSFQLEAKCPISVKLSEQSVIVFGRRRRSGETASCRQDEEGGRVSAGGRGRAACGAGAQIIRPASVSALRLSCVDRSARPAPMPIRVRRARRRSVVHRPEFSTAQRF